MAAEDAARFASTGGTAEEVIALAPDIVVADIFLPPPTKEALENAGLRVEQVGIASTRAESYAQVRQLAAWTSEEAAGEALVTRIETAWDAAEYSGMPVETLLWQEGGIVPGEGSLAADILEHSGFTLQSAARGMGQGTYLPLEQVMVDPPALVLAAGDERMLRHPVLRELARVRYETFDSALLYCGGPTIPRALTRLREIRSNLDSREGGNLSQARARLSPSREFPR